LYRISTDGGGNFELNNAIGGGTDTINYGRICGNFNSEWNKNRT
jgi:hypothetical protein